MVYAQYNVFFFVYLFYFIQSWWYLYGLHNAVIVVMQFGPVLEIQVHVGKIFYIKTRSLQKDRTGCYTLTLVFFVTPGNVLCLTVCSLDIHRYVNAYLFIFI